LKYDRRNVELNSLKAEISNAAYIYQDFCDRNIELKEREDELLHIICELEAKKTELQSTILTESLSMLESQDHNVDNNNLDREVTLS
jgi:hypothetical protein